eukprot:PITA_05826
METVCYLVNISPSSDLEDETPHEVWIGKKPSLSHLRVFGYDENVHAPKVRDVIKHKFLPKETENIEFELKEEESISIAEQESEDEMPQTPFVRRSIRERKPERRSPSTFCSNFSLSIIDGTHRTLREALDSNDGKQWKEAMVDEMESLDKNEASVLVELLAGRKPTGRKWVFKKNMNA